MLWKWQKAYITFFHLPAGICHILPFLFAVNTRNECGSRGKRACCRCLEQFELEGLGIAC